MIAKAMVSAMLHYYSGGSISKQVRNSDGP